MIGEERPSVSSLETVKIAEPKPNFEIRPWGRFDILYEDEAQKVKKITVNPGARLSLQSHEYRTEHWIVVSGMADVTVNDEVIRVTAGQNILIPVTARHRASNPGTEPLVFTEIQVGTYFGEDDIVRYQDDFGRA